MICFVFSIKENSMSDPYGIMSKTYGHISIDVLVHANHLEDNSNLSKMLLMGILEWLEGTKCSISTIEATT